MGLDAVLFTLFSSMDSVESSLLVSFVQEAAIPAAIVLIILCILIFAKSQRKIVLHIGNKIRFKIYPLSKVASIATAFVAALCLLFVAAEKMQVFSYLQSTSNATTFIEENYVDPNTTEIVFPQQKQNLIYIYLESMETTFLSTDLGGGNDVNPIPELYELAQQNINFSQNNSVGGFSSLSGSTWTVGALVSSSAGVPLKTPFNIGGNDYGKTTFLPGLTTLSDILHENGYYQAIMFGSDASFGSRDNYYLQHQTDKIYDLYTSYQDGIVPDGYKVWWGIDDLHLFDYAKEKLTELASQEQPFAFTMLTADTHHIGGYVCELCGNDYSEQYENVLACSSKQVYAFVQWIQQQDFYQNTTIIIAGDHPTMDAEYISTNITEGYDRKVYNCFINSLSTTQNTKNREFCSMDMFPTTLAAIGCTIEGDRLSLGTNLFSSTPTLCEELGTDNFNSQLENDSEYYNQNFLGIH